MKKLLSALTPAYFSLALACLSLGSLNPAPVKAQSLSIESRVLTPDRTRMRVTGTTPVLGGRASLRGFFDAFIGSSEYSANAKKYFGRTFATIPITSVGPVGISLGSITAHGSNPADQGYAGANISYGVKKLDDEGQERSSFNVNARAFPVPFGLFTPFKGDKTPLFGLRLRYRHTLGNPNEEGDVSTLTYSFFGDTNNLKNWDYGELYVTLNSKSGLFVSGGLELTARRDEERKVQGLVPDVNITARVGYLFN